MIINWLPTALLKRKTNLTVRSKVAKAPARGTMRIEKVEDRLVLSPQITLSTAPPAGFFTLEATQVALNNTLTATGIAPTIAIANNDPLAAADIQTVTIDSIGGTFNTPGGFAKVGTNKYEIQDTGTIAAVMADLAALKFTPDASAIAGGPDFLGTAQITVKDHDQGNGTTIAPSDATATFGIKVSPVYGVGNNLPTIKVAGVVGGSAIFATPLANLTLDAAHGNAVSLTDPNVPSSDLFTLTVTVGNDAAGNAFATLKLAGLTGTSSSTGPGGATTTVWSGTLAQVQAGLGGATLQANAGAVPGVYPVVLSATDVTHNQFPFGPANTGIGIIALTVQQTSAVAPVLTVGTNTGYNTGKVAGVVDAAVAPNLTVAGPNVTTATITDSIGTDTLYIDASLLTTTVAGTFFTGTNIQVPVGLAAGAPMVLNGADSAANYQKVIDAIHFKGPDNVNVRAITITAGNGPGATDQALPAVSIVNPVGLASSLTISTAPVNVNQNSSSNAITGVSVSDPNYTGPVQLVLTPSAGTIAVNTGSGITLVPNAPGSPAGTLTFFGSLAQINGALSGLTYTPAAGATGSASINIVGTELSANGKAVSNVLINVLPFNAAPVVHFVGPISTTVNTSVGLGISLTDSDSTNETVIVSVGSGTLTGTAAAGATLTPAGAHAVQIAGTLSAVNLTLATLSYTPALNSVAGDTVNVTASDGTNLSFNSAAITVNATAVAPTVNAGAVVAPTANAGGAAVAVSGLTVTNNDLPAGSGNMSVTLTSASGVTLSASNAGGATVGAPGSTLTIAGTTAQVNAALATLTFKADNTVATGNVTVNVSATESIGSLNGTGSFTVHVQAGPVISGGNLGDTLSVKVHKAAVVFGALTVTDSAASFAGGALTFDLGSATKGDRLSIRAGSGVQITGNSIRVGGVKIATFKATATHIVVTLNASATTSNLETLIGAITFHSTRVGSADRVATLSLNDGTSPITASGTVSIHVHK